MLLEFFEFTPFAKTQSVPTMLTSENEDKSMNFSCCRGTADNPKPPASCYYTVFHEGKVKVKETNEDINIPANIKNIVFDNCSLLFKTSPSSLPRELSVNSCCLGSPQGHQQ